MPGIVGLVGLGPPDQNRNIVSRMVKSMLHEPFYTSGSYVNEQLGLYFGWVCRKDSFDNCMPIWNETKDILLIFTGENYIDQSELDNLRLQNHLFHVGNASYLVHLYEEKGIEFLEMLNGRYSGVLLDLRENKCVLFNDRYGLSRIYQYGADQSFSFASEAKALLLVFSELRQLNAKSFGEFFLCGCPLQNRTLFRGISLVPGGSAWQILPSKEFKKESYFKKENWENLEQLSITEYYEKLKKTWEKILPRYAIGRDNLAVSLTGGKDSRMIMAWSQCLPGRLPCYTFGSMYRDSEDVRLARLIANVCQQSHKVIPVGKDFLGQFASLAEDTVFLTDGAMDVSGAPDLYVSRLARQIAPGRMTGNYGQEVLRGAIAFKPNQLCGEIFETGFRKVVHGAVKTYFNELDENKCLFIMSKQIPWHHYSRLSLELSQLAIHSPYLDNDLVNLAFQIPPELTKSIGPQLRLIFEGNRLLGEICTDRGMLYKSLPLITKMKNFYQEFTFKAESAYDHRMPHWLAKFDHFLESLHLERVFLGRHKFYHFRIWYREELSQYVKEILFDSRTRSRPYLNNQFIEKIVKEHTEGRRNYTNEIHMLLTSELIQRKLVEV